MEVRLLEAPGWLPSVASCRRTRILVSISSPISKENDIDCRLSLPRLFFCLACVRVVRDILFGGPAVHPVVAADVLRIWEKISGENAARRPHDEVITISGEEYDEGQIQEGKVRFLGFWQRRNTRS